MNKFIFLFLLLSNISFSQTNDKKKNLQVQIKNENLPKNEITISGFNFKNRTLNYITSFNVSNAEKSTDSLGKIKISTNRSIFLYTIPNKSYSPIFIELFPGEEIHCALDQMQDLKLSSNNILRSTELSFYYKNPLFGSGYDQIGKMSLNRTSFQILEYIDSVELARKVYLKEFAEHNKISDHFISLINKQIQNNKYKALASYFLTNKGVNPKGYLSVIERLKRFYCSIDTQLSYEYELGADIFCQFLAQKELNLKINPENLFNTAIKFYKGKTLDATLFTYIKLALNVNSQLNRKLLNEFYTRCKDPDYIDIIKSEELKYNLATDKNIIDGLILLDKSKSSWSQQLAKYKGKVIYIDFWASWCGPCINEIPFIEKLKKQYVNKDIVFISISTDKQFSDWKWKVDQLKIANSFSFLLADTDNSPLIKSLEIKTIPRFVLIDKTGKIVSKDAIRPSDKNINILIDQFLK